MTIQYNEDKKYFHLQNESVSYVIALEEETYVSHQYWGKRINAFSQVADYPRQDNAFAPNPYDVTGREFSLATLPQEFPGNGSGDFRESAFECLYADNTTVSLLTYKGHEILSGKQPLTGLPQTYETKEEAAETLLLTMEDVITKAQVTLVYTLFADYPIVTRSARFTNSGTETVHLNKALSMSIDFPDSAFDMIQLPGAWGRERQIVRSPLVRGIHRLDSKRGTTSHAYQPFVALAGKDANEDQGEVYGFHFVYSGEFVANVEVDTYAQTRVQMGISPEHFQWKLAAGETFQTPEVVLVYSDEGMNGLSQTLHPFYQKHLVRGAHQFAERPVLINNWEGTYFDFTPEKIEAMAEESAALGVELFVLDDGWFGKRDDDYSSLGDWFVHDKKLPNGLKALSEAIKAKGMLFGLWFEPEMISGDSELYRAHPDWCVHTPGREKSLGRSQYVLDFSRKEVRDDILAQMMKILDEVPIDYIKWDYNRNMTEIGTAAKNALPGEVLHNYMLGLYEVMEALVTKYPHILFESCSGGGGRYDPGILYYMPQTWTSDNTDAVARLEIQYGTSLVMPISSMASHVSAVPNHQVHRMTSMKMRGDVAMAGNLGYELDVTTLSEEEKAEMKDQIAFYKKHRKLIQYGTFHRILNPFETQNEAAWIFVSPEKEEAIYFYYRVLDRANMKRKKVIFKGLDPAKVYAVTGYEEPIGGDELMNRGLYLKEALQGDYQSACMVLKALA
ncbi:glycoside hydrolase clan gh-d [Trichococcus palustris]|uniref:Alpha-galactosidase n=1 Tax=Trichococcus palustris TaxID=140314 RepID=A0A143YCM5_9LACT|nr:alpha-galactosidase [Trichococcus palustris]CZQ85320.1 glycoside hydrolase clan gh-d [Trichococcus palustris]SFK55571.1 alpha-galactosidase [Trichococcus palustris]